MSSGSIQIDFLKESNLWLTEYENQKKYAISESDTNPHTERLCIYVLGGWAVNRHHHYRETNDIDIVGEKKQMTELLSSLNYQGKFLPVSTPDSTSRYTRKHTLKNEDNDRFSLELRYFNEPNGDISFGQFQLSRHWLYDGSENFAERVIGNLPYVKVPSIKKLIILKFISIIGREMNAKYMDKIVGDFVDIHDLQLAGSFDDLEIKSVLQMLQSLGFDKHGSDYVARLDRLIDQIQNKVENTITEKSILLSVRDLYASPLPKKSVHTSQPAERPAKTRTFSNAFNDTELLLSEYDDWLIGALNFDEDLHFSSFYLDQSWQHILPAEFKEYGYRNMIACYHEFEETYFIPEQECKRVADRLIYRIKSEPKWFDEILDNIITNAESLLKVFDSFPEGNPFKDLNNSQLLEHYIKHNEVHSKLYVYSRLPEALDRGKNYFTDTLKDYLRGLHEDLKDVKKLNEVFEFFTFPENVSIAGQEFQEFMGILEKIKNDENLKELFSGRGGSTRKILLKTKPEFLKEIDDHRQKWMFWNYHGYGTRVLRDISYYLDKFRRGLNDSALHEKAMKYPILLKEADDRKKEYYKKYNVDIVHQQMFRLYSRIGAVKLYRRYVQLQNFYYFDQLISRISHNLNTEEEIIRNLIPSEIEKLLRGEMSVGPVHVDRVSDAAVVYFSNRKVILSGEDAKTVAVLIKDLARRSDFKKDVLAGEPCVRQTRIIKGHCRVVIRKEDMVGLVFNYGDILVCEAADPDLYDYMKIAGAVLTEQGGVTSHSATYCRENNIASITGIEGLLETIFNNDLVEVDTELGRIYKLSSGISGSIISPDAENLNSQMIGNKAFNLVRLKKLGFNVPNFFCISLDSLSAVLKKGTQDSIGSINQILWSEIGERLHELGDDLFALRSSFNNEDGDLVSGAGVNTSELHLSQEDLVKTIINLGSEIIFESPKKVTGSLILQDMILGDISGIVFSTNPVGNGNEILIEAVPGGNELLTDGKIRPLKFTVDRTTFQIIEHPEPGIWKDLIDESIIQEVASQALKIEAEFEKPQDIEWTVVNKKLYILQARPITKFQPDAETPFYRTSQSKGNDIISIYRSYRIPENLQRHMLLVAAVGKWIIVNRKDRKKLNEKDVITALLLHDLGNIVKGVNESFSHLFPDRYRYLPYWKAVRTWVIDRYGETDTEATFNMVREIGVSDRVMYLITHKQFLNNEFIRDCDDMELKICAYADQRVSPYGVVDIRDRLREAVNRYRNVEQKISVNAPNRDLLIEVAVEIESQIFMEMKKRPKEAVTGYGIYEKELRDFVL